MSVDTKELILDVAERLIAEKGIDAVSLRSIIKAADVNLAAIHYHFGSKEALVRKVFARRIRPLNAERIAMLDELEAKANGRPLEVEEVLRALVAPAFRMYEGERGRLFLRMCGRIYAEPAPYLEETFLELFHELIARLRSAIAHALPEVPEAERAWGVHFAVGAMIHTMMESERLKFFSKGLCDPADTEAVIGRIVRFAAAGMRAFATDPGNGKDRPVVAETIGIPE